MRLFDRKFGVGALSALPDMPGVYRFLDEKGEVVYVGKAKRLRRRVGQYRTATERRKHRRMRKIIRAAASFTYDVTSSHLDACLLEVRLIQALRPKFNIASAFSFRYPFLGVACEGDRLHFVLTTHGELAGGSDWAMFGAFRSREVCAEAFFALMRLMSFLGHREPRRRLKTLPPKAARSYIYAFRCLPGIWYERWQDFFLGRCRRALEELSLALLEAPDARARAADIASDLKALLRFWQEEAQPLRRALHETAYAGVYPVPQLERDPLFIRLREAKESDVCAGLPP